MIPNFYASKNYKYLILVPALLVLASLALIFFKGVPQGVDLKGGVLLNIQTSGQVDVASLQQSVETVAKVSGIRTFSSIGGTGVEIELENNEKLSQLEEKVRTLQAKDSLLRELEVNASTAEGAELIRLTTEQSSLNAEVLGAVSPLLVELGTSYSGSDGHEAVRKLVSEYGKAQDVYRTAVIEAVKQKVQVTGFSFREVGPSLSKFFLEKAREILLVSFILAAIAVFILFRSIVPSVAVILGAVVDIVVTLGAMSLFSIPLTLASIAGLLMLIGFSLETDVMLTMRVLKRKEDTASERAFSAFKTGSLMNLTTIGAFGLLSLAGLYLQIPTYYEIGIVAAIGGVIDFAATWGANAVFVLMYAEKQEAKNRV